MGNVCKIRFGAASCTCYRNAILFVWQFAKAVDEQVYEILYNIAVRCNSFLEDATTLGADCIRRQVCHH